MIAWPTEGPLGNPGVRADSERSQGRSGGDETIGVCLAPQVPTELTDPFEMMRAKGGNELADLSSLLAPEKYVCRSLGETRIAVFQLNRYSMAVSAATGVMRRS